MTQRIQKAMADAGYGSRREIEQWLRDGRLSLNGKRAKLGDKVDHTDRLLLDGKIVTLQNHAPRIKAIIYHKPEGEICSRKDPKGRASVFDALPPLPMGRWVAVGRLDLNTSGLLLFTNNGELANALMHPRYEVEREYMVRIRGSASKQQLETLTQKGVKIDGKLAKFERVLPVESPQGASNMYYRVVIKEGKYREVRRMWEQIGLTVSRLKRIRYATIKLSRQLRKGQIEKVAPKQLEKLIAHLELEQQFAEHIPAKSKPKPEQRAAKNTRQRR